MRSCPKCGCCLEEDPNTYYCPFCRTLYGSDMQPVKGRKMNKKETLEGVVCWIGDSPILAINRGSEDGGHYAVGTLVPADLVGRRVRVTVEVIEEGPIGTTATGGAVSDSFKEE